MRAKYFAALALHFGVRPWEIDLLTIGEFYALCDCLDEMAKESKRGNS